MNTILLRLLDMGYDLPFSPYPAFISKKLLSVSILVLQLDIVFCQETLLLIGLNVHSNLLRLIP